ncbi:helix-turn-helix domain-containing protein [Agathobaculum desmolans]|uniref:helix-turn-helix domain-containing protein n=1 Tax=Agathobaculum desmolans TaxID=39484 RepID=UPI0009903924|nr:helix-turn-helix transcriptional regulator [Agathobaculum desmolans]
MIKLLSERLRNLRIEKGLSQKQVATLIGVNPSTISTYESTARLPSYPSLIRLAKVYGVSIDYLLGTEGSRPADLLNRLSGEERKIISEIAEVLLRHVDRSRSR